MAEREQTIKEEIANAVTHGFGILFALISIPLLLNCAYECPSSTAVWSSAVFSFGMLMVYISSTLFHAIQKPGVKRILQVWDHISIYILIAGTYTPIVMKFIPHLTAIIFLGIMWMVVLIAGILKIFHTGKYPIVSVVIYLALGWMAIFLIKPIYMNMPWDIFKWILAGGLSYTLGVAFYLRTKLPYHHAIWHCFVLFGTIAHFIAIYYSLPLKVNF